MESVPCIFCGSNSYIIQYQIPDLLLDHKEELFSLVKCDHCGLLYQNPRPDRKEIGRYYPKEYESYNQERSRSWLTRKVNQAGVNKRSRIINSLQEGKTGGRLLDIGCSTGLFLNKLQQSKLWEVWGVETSEYSVKIAREQYHLNVFHGELSEGNFQNGFFDVVTLWDVLEHLPDPISTLSEVSRITKPHSFLVLRVPNFDSLDAKLFRSTWEGIDLPRHYYVFSRNNINWLLNRNGYEVNKVSCSIGTYPAFLLSLRFYLTARGIENSMRQKIIQILNHPISRLLTAPLFYFYGLFMLGSEITVVAQKK